MSNWFAKEVVYFRDEVCTSDVSQYSKCQCGRIHLTLKNPLFINGVECTDLYIPQKWKHKMLPFVDLRFIKHLNGTQFCNGCRKAIVDDIASAAEVKLIDKIAAKIDARNVSVGSVLQINVYFDFSRKSYKNTVNINVPVVYAGLCGAEKRKTYTYANEATPTGNHDAYYVANTIIEHVKESFTEGAPDFESDQVVNFSKDLAKPVIIQVNKIAKSLNEYNTAVKPIEYAEFDIVNLLEITPDGIYFVFSTDDDYEGKHQTPAMSKTLFIKHDGNYTLVNNTNDRQVFTDYATAKSLLATVSLMFGGAYGFRSIFNDD